MPVNRYPHATKGLPPPLHFWETSHAALDRSLCSVDPHPAIVRVRSPKSGEYPKHYVLVTGKDIEPDGTVRYLLADPGDFSGDLNSGPYIDALGRPEFRTRGSVVRSTTPSNLSGLELSVGDVADLMVIDSSGRRTGFDSAAGTHVSEIPGSSTFRDSISNNTIAALNAAGQGGTGVAHTVQIAQPPDGPYRVVLTGLRSGTYELLTNAFREDGTAQGPVSHAGNVALGSSLSFALNYSSTGPPVDVQPILGDLNGDGSVDCTDVAIVRASFGKKTGQPGFDPRADVTVDGVVDIRDLAFVGQKLPAGTVCGPTLSVTKTGTGHGEVVSEPSGIDCGPVCSKQFKQGSQVMLTAKPASNSVFVGWGGACTGSDSSAAVTILSDQTCTASFELITKTLTVTKTGGGTGTIRSTPGGIDCEPNCSASFAIDSPVTLAATPAAFSLFKAWSGDCSGTTPSITISMSGDKSCTAEFQPEPVSIYYQAHVAGIGWLPEVADGAVAGTTGQSRQMEAIRIRATGGCRVIYQAHVADIGWLPEVSDGAVAGTTGQSRRMEALRVRLDCGHVWHVIYQAHVGDIGWLQEVSDWGIAGTTGQSRRMEAVKIRAVWIPGGV